MDNDGGLSSRKLWMSYAAMVAIGLGFLAAGKYTELHVVYGEYVAGILAATTIYAGSNTLVKHLMTRHLMKTKKKAPAAPAAEQSPEEPKKD